jgi:hypothetical protein
VRAAVAPSAARSAQSTSRPSKLGGGHQLDCLVNRVEPASASERQPTRKVDHPAAQVRIVGRYDDLDALAGPVGRAYLLLVEFAHLHHPVAPLPGEHHRGRRGPSQLSGSTGYHGRFASLVEPARCRC